MGTQSDKHDGKPAFVIRLEKAFGLPSQNAFGSSVFFVPVDEELESLESDAFGKYRYFVGESWSRLGEQNWTDGWCSVFVRGPNSSPNIVAELKSITNREARQVVGLLFENQEDPDESRAALAQAFDSELVTELRVFKIGDGAAMSGVLIAAKLSNTGSLFLTLLLD